MTFAKRHEHEFREIRALASEIGESTGEVLERIGEARAQLADPDPLLAFVHIPKTAGGTATTMLASAYSKSGLHDAGNYVRAPEATVRSLTKRQGGWRTWQRRGGRVTIGHVPYGVFRERLPSDARYMAFLREPVDRVLSHYFRHMHRPDLSPAQRLEGRQNGRIVTGSIEEALLEIRVPQLRNLATRFLCSDPSPMGELSDSALDDAKANLRKFTFVGVQERFEESLVLLQRTLGLSVIPYLNRHVSLEGRRPAVEEIPDEQRELIADCNRLDAELYAFAVDLFEDALPVADESFATDVETLRTASADANEEAIQVARAWLDRELPVGRPRPANALREAARADGVPIPAFKRQIKLMSLKSGRDQDGQTILVRTEESNGDSDDPTERDRQDAADKTGDASDVR